MVQKRLRLAAIGLLAFVSLTVFSGTAQADQTNPPTGLSAVRLDESHYQVSWTAPVAPVAPVTSYLLQLDGQTVDVFKLQRGSLPTSYSVSDLELRRGGQLTVRATLGTGLITPPSSPFSLPAQPGAAPVDPIVPAATASGPSAYNQNNFGNGLIAPKYTDTNTPTPFEAYGLSAGFANIIDTYGTSPKDLFNGVINTLAVMLWYMQIMVVLGSSIFLLWALNRRLYAGVGAAVAMVVQSFNASLLHNDLVLIAAAGVLLWSLVMFFRSQSAVIRGGALALVWSAISLVFVGNANWLVTNGIDAPLTGVQFIVTEIDQWNIPGDTGSDYNLSVVPTYNGSPLEQGIRRNINEDWLQTAYPTYCQINFGDVKWATTNYVPNDSSLPSYNHLTFCEYLLKAEVENNTAALDKLKSGDSWGGAGAHHTGSVEQAAPAAWTFFQGKQPIQRVIYAGISLLATSLHSLLKVSTAVVTAYVVLTLAWDFILLAFLLVVSPIPWMRQRVLVHLQGMLNRTYIPMLLMAIFMIATKISSLLFTIGGDQGWLMVMSIRALFSLVMVIVAFRFAWGRFRHKRNPFTASHSFKAVGSGPTIPASAAASAPGSAGSSNPGGTYAYNGAGAGGSSVPRPAPPPPPQLEQRRVIHGDVERVGTEPIKGTVVPVGRSPERSSLPPTHVTLSRQVTSRPAAPRALPPGKK